MDEDKMIWDFLRHKYHLLNKSIWTDEMKHSHWLIKQYLQYARKCEGKKLPTSESALPISVVSGMLPISKIEEQIEYLIKWNRKNCWESEFENDNYCIGEDKLRDYIKQLKRGNYR